MGLSTGVKRPNTYATIYLKDIRSLSLEPITLIRPAQNTIKCKVWYPLHTNIGHAKLHTDINSVVHMIVSMVFIARSRTPLPLCVVPVGNRLQSKVLLLVVRFHRKHFCMGDQFSSAVQCPVTERSASSHVIRLVASPFCQCSALICSVSTEHQAETSCNQVVINSAT